MTTNKQKKLLMPIMVHRETSKEIQILKAILGLKSAEEVVLKGLEKIRINKINNINPINKVAKNEEDKNN